MARPASTNPTELELEILKILWQEGPLPVRDVRTALAATRKLAYTSVMTVMGIMVEKGYLQRVKRGRSYVYRPRIGEKATRRRILGDVVKRVFDGSPAAAMLHLVETSDLTDREIDELRASIGRKAREKEP